MALLHAPTGAAGGAPPVYCDDGVCWDVPGGPPGYSQQAQSDMAPFAARIAEIGHKYDEFGQTGLDYVDNSVVVWWHGPLPLEMDAVRAEAAAEGIGLKVVPIRFGEKPLNDAMLEIFRNWPEGAPPGNAIRPTDDFSGLTVSGPEVSTDAVAQQRVRAIANRVAAGIPITFGPYTPITLLDSRGLRLMIGSTHHSLTMRPL